MEKYNKYFYLVGIAFIVFTMFKILQRQDVFIQQEGLATFEALQKATNKAGWWAIPAIIALWFPQIIEWKNKGVKIEGSKIRSELIESVFPSFGRLIPRFAQFIRLAGLVLFFYSSMSGVSVIDGEIDISPDYYFLMALGGLLFFCLPFLFPKKDAT